jgi:hypothetical protein
MESSGIPRNGSQMDRSLGCTNARPVLFLKPGFELLTFSMKYPDFMEHLEVLREKIARLRLEIAQIQELNRVYRLQGGNGTEAQVAPARGTNGCQQFSTNLPNSLHLAAGCAQYQR